MLLNLNMTLEEIETWLQEECSNAPKLGISRVLPFKTRSDSDNETTERMRVTLIDLGQGMTELCILSHVYNILTSPSAACWETDCEYPQRVLSAGTGSYLTCRVHSRGRYLGHWMPRELLFYSIRGKLQGWYGCIRCSKCSSADGFSILRNVEISLLKMITSPKWWRSLVKRSPQSF